MLVTPRQRLGRHRHRVGDGERRGMRQRDVHRHDALLGGELGGVAVQRHRRLALLVEHNLDVRHPKAPEAGAQGL